MNPNICGHCKLPVGHYLTHICPDCTCAVTEVRDPFEPHIPPLPEISMEPDCPAHGEGAIQ